MRKKHDMLGVWLAAVTGMAFLLSVILRSLLPRIILPQPDAVSFVAISLIALLSDHYILRGSRRNYLLIPVYAALIFGIFPVAAFAVEPLYGINLAILGAGTFTVVTFLFDSIRERLESGPVARLAPLFGAFGLFLVAQCLMGII